MAPVTDEFAGANLGDSRRTRRLRQMVERLSQEPSQSFPKALVTVGELEAGYRFFGNSAVEPDAILQPHRQRTWSRAGAASGWLLALEDTSEMRYAGTAERVGLGPLMNGGHGFYFHAGLLAVLGDAAERAMPLGVAFHEVLVRRKDIPKRPWRDAYADPDKESLRWHRVMERITEDAEKAEVEVIHVADREAGTYDFMVNCCSRGTRFIVRARHGFLDRATLGPLFTATLQRRVNISARKVRGGNRRVKKPREGRVATLTVTGQTVELRKPRHVRAYGQIDSPLYVVTVTELNPPEDCEAVSWTLITTESVNEEASLARVVDAYRSRWLIEEFFKALKTGCAMERRQLASLHTLHNALAVFTPIAWHMLLLRGIVRDAPDTPAEAVIAAGHLKLLKRIAARDKARGLKLSSKPTTRELLFAIARLGGHLPNNGIPGWITLRRGYDELFKLEQAVLALGFEM